MIQFSYAVPNVWVYFSYNELVDVIYHVKFEVTGTKNGRSFTSSEGLDIDTSSITNFIPFDQISEAEVIQWVQTQYPDRLLEIKKHIEEYINELISPTKEMRTLQA